MEITQKLPPYMEVYGARPMKNWTPPRLITQDTTRRIDMMNPYTNQNNQQNSITTEAINQTVSIDSQVERNEQYHKSTAKMNVSYDNFV